MHLEIRRWGKSNSSNCQRKWFAFAYCTSKLRVECVLGKAEVALEFIRLALENCFRKVLANISTSGNLYAKRVKVSVPVLSAGYSSTKCIYSLDINCWKKQC